MSTMQIQVLGSDGEVIHFITLKKDDIGSLADGWKASKGGRDDPDAEALGKEYLASVMVLNILHDGLEPYYVSDIDDD